MSLTYGSPGSTNTINDNQLCSFDTAQTLATQLGGIVLNMVDIIAPGKPVVPDPQGRGWYAVTVNQKLYTGVNAPIPCFLLIRQQTGSEDITLPIKDGSWHVSPLNQQPLWIVNPPVVPILVPPVPVPGQTFPGFGDQTAQQNPVVAALSPQLKSISDKLDSILLQLQMK